jgi:hypothetical protein
VFSDSVMQKLLGGAVADSMGARPDWVRSVVVKVVVKVAKRYFDVYLPPLRDEISSTQASSSYGTLYGAAGP